MRSEQNLFKDTNYDDGFLYVYSDKDPEGGKVHYPGVLFPNVVGIPFFRITHWWTKYPFTEFQPTTPANNRKKHTTAPAMQVSIEDTEKGTAVSLDLNAEKEYAGHTRKEGEGFPHLLLECFFNDSPTIGDLTSIKLSFDVMIESCINYMEPLKYNPDLHCAHTSAIFAIENNNKNSPSYKEYLWFIVPVFDSRYIVARGGEMQDGGDESQEKIGTGMYIYSPDGSLFWDNKINDGKWHTFDRDILPLIKKAFSSAQKKGYLKGAKEKDLQFKSFNFGWEITGNFHAAMKIRSLKCLCN